MSTITQRALTTAFALAVSSALLTQARAEETDDRAWAPQCPDAAAWLDAHPEQSEEAMKTRDAARKLREPQLRDELQRRVDNEQAARQRYVSNGYRERDRQTAFRLDGENYNWLTNQLKGREFPTADDIGEYGLHLMWLLVHHADRDPQFQLDTLRQFEIRWQRREFASDDLARLTDRILRKTGRPQRYGTQHDWAGALQQGLAVANLADIDRARADIGLMPLKDYGCMMHELRKSTAR